MNYFECEGYGRVARPYIVGLLGLRYPKLSPLAAFRAAENASSVPISQVRLSTGPLGEARVIARTGDAIEAVAWFGSEAKARAYLQRYRPDLLALLDKAEGNGHG